MRLSRNYTWWHQVVNHKVHDGDTLTGVVIDLGHHVVIEGRLIRLTSGRGPINAPEVVGVEKHAGILVRNWVDQWCFDRELWLRSESLDKDAYGRVIGRIFRDGPHGGEIGIEMLEAGLVKMCGEGGKRIPFTESELDAIIRKLA